MLEACSNFKCGQLFLFFQWHQALMTAIPYQSDTNPKCFQSVCQTEKLSFQSINSVHNLISDNNQ
jgi:hypothetical protein